MSDTANMKKKRPFKAKSSKGGFAGRFSSQKLLQEAQRKELIKIARKQALSVFSSHIEEKYIDTASTGISVDYSGALGLFTMPSAGTGVSGRTGDEIQVTRLEFKYSLVVADATNLVRILLFKWNNDDGSYTPGVASILSSGDPTTAYAALSRYNWDNQKAGDFEILYDRCHQLTTNGEQAQVHQVQLWGKGLGSSSKLQLNSGATTGKGRYGLLYISDSAAVSHPSLIYTCRISYKDA